MVRLGAGRFQMGTTADELSGVLARCTREPYGTRCLPSQFADELPLHSVELASFWLHRREVTVREYRHCVRRGLCLPRPSSARVEKREQPDFPVSRTSWYDARDYCASVGARLPSEAEFERAARGLQRRRFPWGSLFNRRVANIGRFGWVKTDETDGFRRLAPVGSFPAGASADGILDLAGNVSEWVADYYRPYEQGGGGASAASLPGRSSVRGIRGGSYQSGQAWVRGSARSYAPPSDRSETTGFRCARSADR